MLTDTENQIIVHMFPLGRFIGIKENSQIISGCLPTVSVKCQHSSERTGNRNQLNTQNMTIFYKLLYILFPTKIKY